MSKFKEDLEKEAILGKFLDGVYEGLNISLQRISDTDLQHQGIDLIYLSNEETIHIDEKAQLHYLNKDLPTFTFELSYLKNTILKQGWLFDKKKRTDYYFLVTGIFLKNEYLKNSTDILKCKITSINRPKLIAHLQRLGLSLAKLQFYDQELRENAQFGKHAIEEINMKYGSIHFTQHLPEKPINLKLRLDYLIRMKIAKRLFPIG